jgi:hypothetical protein
MLLDLSISVAIGSDCLADVALLGAELAMFGRVASDPTVSRLVDELAVTPVVALGAINQGRALVRERLWKLAGTDAPDHQVSADRPLVIDLDGTSVNLTADQAEGLDSKPGHCPPSL